MNTDRPKKKVKQYSNIVHSEKDRYIGKVHVNDLHNVEDQHLAIREIQRRTENLLAAKAKIVSEFLDKVKAGKLAGYYNASENGSDPVLRTGSAYAKRKVRGEDDGNGNLWEPYTRQYYPKELFKIINPYSLLKSQWNQKTLTEAYDTKGDAGQIRRDWFEKGKAFEMAEKLGIPEAHNIVTLKYSPRKSNS